MPKIIKYINFTVILFIINAYKFEYNFLIFINFQLY